MVVGYLMLNLSLKNIRKVLFGVVAVFSITFIVSNTIGKDVLDQYLWRRVQFADGAIEIENNRTTSNFDSKFDRIMSSEDKWLGIPDLDSNQGDGGNAGVKVYLVQRGIVGVMLIFLIYFSYFFFNRKRNIRVLILINILLLSQSGGPLWFCCFASYVLGVGYLRTVNRNTSSILIPLKRNESSIHTP